MAETHILTVPVVPTTRTAYSTSRILFDWDNAIVQVLLKGNDGTEVLVNYSGATATSLMSALNTVNLSTTSLDKRILNRLQADGFIAAGAVSGVPR